MRSVMVSYFYFFGNNSQRVARALRTARNTIRSQRMSRTVRRAHNSRSEWNKLRQLKSVSFWVWNGVERTIDDLNWNWKCSFPIESRRASADFIGFSCKLRKCPQLPYFIVSFSFIAASTVDGKRICHRFWPPFNQRQSIRLIVQVYKTGSSKWTATH